MNRRQNFTDTMNHVKPAELVIDFGGNPLSSMEGESERKLLDFLGFDTKGYDEKGLLFGKVRRIDERLLKHFSVDTRSVGGILMPADSQFQMLSENEYIDEWGLRRRYTGLYWEGVDFPLKGATMDDLDSYRFPNPESIDFALVEEYARQARRLYEETDYIICAEHPVYGIFELGCWLCGFEDFLVKMALDEEFIEKFFAKVLAYQKRVIEIYYGALGKWIHYTSSGDDFATQNGPFVSPDMFAELVKPAFAARIAHTKKFTAAKFLHHSCGSVYSLVGELVDAGVEILNPIQPKARDMSPEKLKTAYGGRVVFHGGIDTQELLPFCTDEEIEQAVKETIAVMNQNGGYILAAAHNIQPDVNPRSLTVMLEAANKYRRL